MLRERIFFRRTIGVALLALSIAVLASGGAEARLPKDQYTEMEKLGFAFYRLSGIPPDFETWISDSLAFFDTKPLEKQQFVRNELQRLDQGFRDYTPLEDFIAIRTPIHATTFDFKSSDPAVMKLKIAKKIAFTIKGMPDSHIPFEIGKTWVAVVPQDYGRFMNLYLTGEQYNLLRNTVPGISRANSNVIFDGEMEMVLKPTGVDTEKPMKINGDDMWLMGAEVASMIVWTKDRKKTLWTYFAPWYMTPAGKELLDLYHK